jgi:hypothetical protein
MRALITKLLIFIAIANAVGLQDAFAKDDSGTIPEAVEATASQDTDGDAHSESDCDTETCAQHQCHLGHCQFDPSIHPIDFSLYHFAQLLATSHVEGSILSDFRFRLIKPPCA